jgi:protein O-mannosyl-transferase
MSAAPATWLVLAVLSLATLVAYWNSFKVPLVFDDLSTIQVNSSVRFGDFYLFGTRALLYALFTLNYLWTGQEVWSYHLINFLLHLLNGILVYLLACKVFTVGAVYDRAYFPDSGKTARSQTAPTVLATLAAAFFLLHPVQTESVTYISSRSELLSTFFYLAGMLIFVFWPERKIGFLCSLAVGVAYFFGIGSKETVVTLPASIFLYDFIFLSRSDFRALLSRWRFYITYVVGVVAAIYIIATRLLPGSIGPNWPGHLSTRQYFLTELRVLVTYVRLVFLPIGLNLDYDIRPSNSPFEPVIIASFLFLCGLAVLAWTLRRRIPVFAFSIFWFFITLSPTSSFVVIADVIFEHRLYLPMIGICFSFPLLIDFVLQKLKERIAIPGKALAYSCVILIALMVGTVLRNYTWGDEVRLWEDIVSKSPHKERPYNALAFALYKRGEYQRAIQVLQSGSEMLPDQGIDFSDTLSNMYLKTGQYQKAIDLINKVIPAISPDHQGIPYNNLGVAYLSMWQQELQSRRSQMPPEEFARKTEEILAPAAEAYQKALAAHSEMFATLDSYVNVSCYRGKGGEIEAKALKKLNQTEKDDFEDLYIVGKVAFNNAVDAEQRANPQEATKDYQKADQYFERAEKLDSNEKLVFFNHGYTLNSLQQPDRAIEKYLQAIRIDPIFIEAHYNLGLIYLRKNELHKAAEAFSEVLRFNPKHVSSNLKLAYIYKVEGDKARARTHLMTVLDAVPGDPQAAAMLRELDTAAP